MRKLLLASAALVLLSACQDTDEFVGQWVWVKNDCSTLEIVKNGNQMLAHIKTPNPFLGGYYKNSAPATAKDGVLTIQLSQPMVMTIEKASGELVGKDRYRRPTGAEKCAMKKE